MHVGPRPCAVCMLPTTARRHRREHPGQLWARCAGHSLRTQRISSGIPTNTSHLMLPGGATAFVVAATIFQLDCFLTILWPAARSRITITPGSCSCRDSALNTPARSTASRPFVAEFFCLPNTRRAGQNRPRRGPVSARILIAPRGLANIRRSSSSKSAHHHVRRTAPGVSGEQYLSQQLLACRSVTGIGTQP